MDLLTESYNFVTEEHNTGQADTKRVMLYHLNIVSLGLLA